MLIDVKMQHKERTETTHCPSKCKKEHGKEFKTLLKKEKEEETSGEQALPTPLTLFSHASQTSAGVEAPNLACLEFVHELTDRIVSVKENGIQKTSFVLSDVQFENSPFFGTEIVITEYSTSPKTYNIELIGSPNAAAFLHGQLGSLHAALESSHLRFSVHRLEVHLSSDGYLEQEMEDDDAEEQEDM